MLVACPITLREGNAFIARHHRHRKPARGCKFVAAAVDTRRQVYCGVAIVGRPNSRVIQQREPLTCEITRLCTDGTRNACSFLCGMVRRVAFVLGYRRVITYTRTDEPGVSLRAAGYSLECNEEGSPVIHKSRSWSCPSRPRTDPADDVDKYLWEACV